jgi:hypothetical protein
MSAPKYSELNVSQAEPQPVHLFPQPVPLFPQPVPLFPQPVPVIHLVYQPQQS